MPARSLAAQIERGIIFSGHSVRAIQAGTKTQTRRLVKAKHLPFIKDLLGGFLDGKWNQRPLPYGKPRERLWVKETFNFSSGDDLLPGENHRLCPERAGWRADRVVWRADGERTHPEQGAAIWKPSIYMPRWASRITLEVTDIRVERLQDITEPDAKAEGVTPLKNPHGVVGAYGHRLGFAVAWDSLNEKRATWESNPWVWVVDFKRVEVADAR